MCWLWIINHTPDLWLISFGIWFSKKYKSPCTYFNISFLGGILLNIIVRNDPGKINTIRLTTVSCEYIPPWVQRLFPAQMMVHDFHYFSIELIYSYISIFFGGKYPDVSILESEFLRMCSKNNLWKKYDLASIKVDDDYLLWCILHRISMFSINIRNYHTG